MNATALIVEKIGGFSMVLPDKDSSGGKENLKIKPRFTSDASLIKNLEERMNTPLKLRPVGFLREFGINE